MGRAYRVEREGMGRGSKDQNISLEAVVSDPFELVLASSLNYRC